MLTPSSGRAPLTAATAATAATGAAARRAPVVTVSEHGVLRSRAAHGTFELVRLPPADDLAFFVERHWVVRWDLTDRAPYPQETLPQPCVNLVIEPGRAAVHGVGTRRFSITLEGRGEVFGTKIKPGAFHPFLRAARAASGASGGSAGAGAARAGVDVSVADLTDRAISIDEAFGGAGGVELARAVRAAPDDLHRVALVEGHLRARLPPPDANVTLVVRIVERALHDRAITSVERLAAHAGLPARALQRLFRKYVGVGPKWVIQRFRMHEAVARAEAGTPVDWAALAHDLGYCDQAHFIRDFKAHVGCSPAEHAAACAR